MTAAANRPLLLGVDVGTGSARAGLFTSEGRLVGRDEHPLQTWHPHPNHVEQSSEEIWRAVASSVHSAMAKAGATAEEVAGIGFDATCSLVAVNGQGLPVTLSTTGAPEQNVIVWMDHRATPDADEITRVGHDVLDFVGGTMSPEMQSPKLRWVKRHLPTSWSDTARWFDLPDFLTWKATGSDVRSTCSTTCKWTYVGHRGGWDRSYFEAMGLDELARDSFAPIGSSCIAPGHCVGGLSDAAAAELGLLPGTPVASSLIDAHAGALGILGAAGSIYPIDRRLAVIAGTSACHIALSRNGPRVRGVWGPYSDAVLRGWWVHEAGISASGAFVDDVVRRATGVRAHEDVLAALDAACTERRARGELPGARVHMQPNVLGNRSPLADPSVTGGLSGWSLRDDLEDQTDWYAAAMQGLAYATRHIVETLDAAGIQPAVLVATGGSTSSAEWLRAHADALGIPIVVPNAAEGVLLGAAMLGATAAGVHENLEAAMEAMSGDSHMVTPDQASRRLHDAKYLVYRRMLDDERAYREIMQDLERFETGQRTVGDSKFETPDS